MHLEQNKNLHQKINRETCLLGIFVIYRNTDVILAGLWVSV